MASSRSTSVYRNGRKRVFAPVVFQLSFLDKDGPRICFQPKCPVIDFLPLDDLLFTVAQSRDESSTAGVHLNYRRQFHLFQNPLSWQLLA